MTAAEIQDAVTGTKPIEELLRDTFPPKFGENLKVSFLFKVEDKRYFRLDFYDSTRENRIGRSYFVWIGTDNIPHREVSHKL